MPKYTNKKQGPHYFERARMKRARPVFKSHYSIMIFHWRGILYYLKLFKHTCSSIQVVCKIIQWFKRRGVTFEGQSGIFILSLTTCFPIGEGGVTLNLNNLNYPSAKISCTKLGWNWPVVALSMSQVNDRDRHYKDQLELLPWVRI